MNSLRSSSRTCLLALNPSLHSRLYSTSATAAQSTRREQAYVQRVSINNERKRNALSLPVLEDLEKQLLAINPDWTYSENWLDLDNIERSLEGVNRRCKVVVLESEGSVFCSG
jgi:enoyl-CoA hydratase/carnithine racemase